MKIKSKRKNHQSEYMQSKEYTHEWFENKNSGASFWCQADENQRTNECMNEWVSEWIFIPNNKCAWFQFWMFFIVCAWLKS